MSSARKLSPWPFGFKTALSIMLALASAYALAQPPFAVNEEREHMALLAELSAFALRSPVDADGHHYHANDAEFERLASNYEPRARDWRARTSVSELLQDLAAPKSGESTVHVPSQTPRLGRLSDLPLVPSFWLGRWLGLSQLAALYLARLSGALCYALLAAWAVSRAGQLAAAFFALGGLPVTLMQAGGVSGEPLCWGLALAFFALLAKATHEPDARSDQRDRLLMLALLSALVTCQPFALAATLCVLALPANAPVHRLLRGPRLFALALGLGCASLLVWVYTNTPPFALAADASPSAEWHFMVGRPLRVLFGLARSFLRELDALWLEFAAFSAPLVAFARFSGGVIALMGSELVFLLALGVHVAAGPIAARGRRWLLASLLSYGLAVMLGALLTQAGPPRSLLPVLPARALVMFAPAVLLALALSGRPGFARFLRARPKTHVILPVLLLNAVALATLVGRYFVAPEHEWPY